MGRPKKVKDPFDLLDGDEKNAIENSSDEELQKRIAEVAMNDAALADAMKKDFDLQQKKDAVKVAMEPYRDAKKANKQRIAYARLLLDARGKPNGDSGLDDRTGSVAAAAQAFKDSIPPGTTVSIAFTGEELRKIGEGGKKLAAEG
jgi:hypothetical protein